MGKYEEYENKMLHYGVCPICGQSCQPDSTFVDDISIEYVTCDDCRIIWNLHHEDDTDKRDDTENWRVYRITDIEDR